jgi:hypothetical protein
MSAIKRGAFYRRHGKRWLDLALALPGLVLAAPVAAAVALAVRWRLGRPVLFRQLRPGLGGRPFTVFKFRTMRDARDPAGRPLSDASRLTRFGSFLRRTSLDELPELLNVVRGEMSLVGPRPLQPRAGAPARGAAGDHRLGAGQRPQRARVGGAVPARRLVRRPPEPGARPEDPGPHTVERAAAPRDQRAGRGDHARVPGRRGAGRGPCRATLTA